MYSVSLLYWCDRLYNVQSITSLTPLCSSMSFKERYNLKMMVLFNSSINDIHLLSSCFPFIMDIDMRYVDCPISLPHHHHLYICNRCTLVYEVCTIESKAFGVKIQDGH